MIGVDIHGSTLGELAVTSAAAVFSSALSGGFYEVLSDSRIYINTLMPDDAEAQFSTGYPLWAGNSKTFRVHEGGKIAAICASGEPDVTVQFIKVWNP